MARLVRGRILEPRSRTKTEDQQEVIIKKIEEGNLSTKDQLINTGVSIGKQVIIRQQIKRNLPQGYNDLVGLASNYLNPNNEDPQDTQELIIEEINNAQLRSPYQPIDNPKREKSVITIRDMDSGTYNDVIALKWIPQSVSYIPESKLVALTSVGRNNPFYNYVGSEDTLEFSIDWFFTNDETREQAIKHATWLESLSKTNGYSELHRVQLVWGNSRLFDNHLFLVQSAAYEMSNWVDWGFSSNPGGPLVDINGRLQFNNAKQYGLLPQQIHQEVRLKKVTEYNLQFDDMRFGAHNNVNIITEEEPTVTPPTNLSYPI